MRVSIVYAIMLLSVSVGFAPRVFAHSSEQTNALICAMLRRFHIDGENNDNN